jgi:hypothetical protein
MHLDRIKSVRRAATPMDFAVDGDHSDVVGLLERATGCRNGRGSS